MRASRTSWLHRRCGAMCTLSLLGVLAIFSPVSPVVAFSAKLIAPWNAFGDASGDRGGEREGGLQIVTEGDADGSAPASGRTGRKKRRRRGGSRSSRRSSSTAREARASADGDVEEAKTETCPAEDAMAAPSEKWIDTTNANGWPNQSSTLRAYQEYVSTASDAVLAMRSSPSLAVGGASAGGASLAVPMRSPARIGAKAGVSSVSARSLGRRGAAATGINGNHNQDKSQPKVKNYLGPLLSMTRPDNFPGVLILHVLGAHKTLRQALLSGAPLSGILADASGQAVSTTLKHALLRVLREPRMMVTIVALLLTTATSMLVNDYYDARSGVDLANVQSHSPKHLSSDESLTAKGKPLATGAVPLPVAKSFLYYLYASLLLSVPFVPGTPAQLSVVLGAMLTFLYTQHLKPVTWLKNALCAGLIAFSPLTSGMAAASLVSQPGTLAVNAIRPAYVSLWRLVITLFAGFMSREMLMDVTDVDGDKAAGIQTIPVRHGLRYASRAAFASAVVMAALAVAGPASRLVGAVWSATALSTGGSEVVSVLSAVLLALLGSGGDLVRLGLAVLASVLMVRGAWAVCKSDGRDIAAAERAVEEGKLSVMPLLASFI
eukprot:CAMPEP_0113527836 /NCGR_PEP_ID=MMETSP0015_2-20120614/1513_1 /TAXON_ID=2838 /ORGANISM="Odontella" /LENGTH=605 /DNA_ID=CAMNT_0000426307 /DNA_START=193 /DNA_END=2010 /DNA_ORIENTATION=- /assembly_acc=CAM_ASM_000160